MNLNIDDDFHKEYLLLGYRNHHTEFHKRFRKKPDKKFSALQNRNVQTGGQIILYKVVSFFFQV